MLCPTLVVGLGGTGTEVVRCAKQHFSQMWRPAETGPGPGGRGPRPAGSSGFGDRGEDLPGVVQMLAVDTEPLVNSPRQPHLRHHEYAFLGGFDAARLLQHLDQRPDIQRWWGSTTLISPGHLQSGTGQVRRLGRLAFFRNYATFKEQLMAKAARLGDLREQELVQERGLGLAADRRLVFVVTSLCGGTGGGMILDVAHWIKDYFGISAHVIGILLLPSLYEDVLRSTFQQHSVRANAYAALKEINACQLRAYHFSVQYPGETAAIPRTPYTPFDSLFLAQRTEHPGEGGGALQQAVAQTARLIYLLSTSAQTERILSQAMNLGVASEAGRSQTAAFSAFDATALSNALEALVRYARHRTAALALYRLALGSVVTAEEVRTSAQAAYDDLVVTLRSRFMEHAGTQALGALRKSLARSAGKPDGLWSAFVQALAESVRHQLRRQGVEGAMALLRLVEPQAAGLSLGGLDGQDLMCKPDGTPYHPSEIEAMRHSPGRFRSMAVAGRQGSTTAPSSAESAGVPDDPKTALRWWDLASVAARRTRAAAARLHDQLDHQLDEVHKAYRTLQDRIRQARIEFDPYPMSEEGREVTTLYDLKGSACEADYPGAFWRARGQGIADDVVLSILARLIDAQFSQESGLEFKVLPAQSGVGGSGLEDELEQQIEMGGLIAARVRQQADLRCIFRLTRYRQGADRRAVEAVRPPGGSILERIGGEPGPQRMPLAEEGFGPAAPARLFTAAEGVDVYWITHGSPLSSIGQVEEMYASYAAGAEPRATWHVLPGGESLAGVYQAPAGDN